MAGDRKMEKNDPRRFEKTPRFAGTLSVLLFCLFIVGCSVLSPVSRPGYVPSYVSEKCEAPVFREGDSWKFIGSSGQEWEEKVVTGEGRLQPVQSQKKDFYGFTFSFGEIEFQNFFPLWVGKSWRGSPMLYTVESIPVTYFLSLKVVDYATVKVKAGTFQCYVIELNISYSLDRGTGFYYYAPEAKSVIKFETQSPFLHKWENFELSSYQVK
jgi:hypothetical protein